MFRAHHPLLKSSLRSMTRKGAFIGQTLSLGARGRPASGATYVFSRGKSTAVFTWGLGTDGQLGHQNFSLVSHTICVVVLQLVHVCANA